MAVYSDISLSFSKHPVTNDVGKITDVNAITNPMRNILTTRLGERPWSCIRGSTRGFIHIHINKIKYNAIYSVYKFRL